MTILETLIPVILATGKLMLLISPCRVSHQAPADSPALRPVSLVCTGRSGCAPPGVAECDMDSEGGGMEVHTNTQAQQATQVLEGEQIIQL